MLTRLSTYFILVIFIIGCKGSKSISSKPNSTNYVTNLQPNYSATLTANNLSETFTKNDEVLFLMYREDPSPATPYPILLKNIIFTPENKVIKYNCNIENIVGNQRLIFVLIEIDSKKNLAQIEPIIRINYKAIINAFNNPKSNDLETYLGDDDLLSIKAIGFKDLMKLNGTLNFKGTHLMDAYDYSLSIQKL